MAEDDFQRVVDQGWGHPATGDAYDVTGTVSDFSVDGELGILRLVKGATRAATAVAAHARDVDLSFRVRLDRLPAGGSVYAYGIARRTEAGAEYRVKVRIAASGDVFIQARAASTAPRRPSATRSRCAGLSWRPDRSWRSALG